MIHYYSVITLSRIVMRSKNNPLDNQRADNLYNSPTQYASIVPPSSMPSQQPQPSYNPYARDPDMTGPPGYSSIYPQDDNNAKLKDFYRKYEISPLFQEDIECVKKYDIHVIADDSGSMVEPSEYLSFRTNKFVKKTRWDELQETVEVITELAILLDDDGIDLWFLNVRDPIKNVTCRETIMKQFNRVPRGRTPLTSVLRRVMQEPSVSGKPKLILIITDGEPNNDDGYDDSDNFLRLLKSRDVDNNRVSILACTSSDTHMQWLNRVDEEAKHVDVIDDYLTERTQILNVQGSSFSYSHGDHILKMLLGPVLQKYDDLDEKPIKKPTGSVSLNRRNKKQNDCVIL